MVKKLIVYLVLIMGLQAGVPVLGFEVNKDGRSLILESEQAYRNDMEDRPVVTDRAMTGYVNKIVKKLIPKNKKPPRGVNLSVTLLESPQPQLYSYTSGHIVMTTGTLLAMENEAQLAGVLSHEVANITEGYYINMYQKIKTAKRRGRMKGVASALIGSLLDVAVDYSADSAAYDISDKWIQGDATYRETMRKITKINAAKSAYYSVKDVIASIPKKDEKNQYIDPRLSLEPVADTMGMVYTARAGYDCTQTARGWKNLYREKKRGLEDQEALLGPWAEQLRQTQSLMRLNLARIQQSMGTSGLVQTRSEIPPTRSEFAARIVNIKEVKEAGKASTPSKGKKSYQRFLTRSMAPRAQKEMDNENYETAYALFKGLWDKGLKTAPISYGMAKSKLGDFAFGASESEKRSAEKAYKQAAAMDHSFALPHKGLGELYEDWDRYADAARSYARYLKLNPGAKDRERIKRKIKICKKRASR